MNGTILSVTLAMLRIPPIITIPTNTANPIPKITLYSCSQGSSPESKANA